jgi:hypothetical protein
MGEREKKIEDAPQHDGEGGFYESGPNNPGSGEDFHQSNPYTCRRHYPPDKKYRPSHRENQRDHHAAAARLGSFGEWKATREALSSYCYGLI